MNIGIAGLGLIGGSIARAFKHDTVDTVLGYDRTPSVVQKALLMEAIDIELDEEKLGICDYVIVAMYPEASADYIERNADRFKKGAVVMDICGVKKYICDRIWPVAKEKGFIFLGTHPMAGTERSGFDNSTHKMFNNASMILVPQEGTPDKVIERVSKLWGSIGFTNIEITDAENHDRIIAYTSQLAHVASNAYIKSPTALDHKGFSAGSYKDLTRVAYLNENMWTELFLENRDNLLKETEHLIAALTEYAGALRDNDADRLRELLKAGREQKEEADRYDLK
ncbi:MAG: prephenate dehydrogenase [Lachnospiraceae bacterium]|nr:prephenate dehydrogenase [Lachnospiraceae bacterium]